MKNITDMFKSTFKFILTEVDFEITDLSIFVTKIS